MSESGTDEVHPSAAAQGKSGFLAFWTTLPGILTGAAAVLTAASSKAACVDALRQRMQDTIQVTSLQPGAELCVQTHDLRVAALKLTQIPGPGAPQLVFEYTIWS